MCKCLLGSCESLSVRVYLSICTLVTMTIFVTVRNEPVCKCVSLLDRYEHMLSVHPGFWKVVLGAKKPRAPGSWLETK